MKIKNNTGSVGTWTGQQIQSGEYYLMEAGEINKWASDSTVLSDISNGNLILNDGVEDILDVATAVQALMSLKNNVQIEGVKIDRDRLLVGDNRVPPGYTLYLTGKSDDISNGAYGAGSNLKFSSSNTIEYFQLLNHYFIIGARAIWENCSIDTNFNAKLIAPATIATETTGDFVKDNLGGPYNRYRPVSAGTGSWSMDLSQKHTNTNILKAVPVPQEGNTGWFDYDSDTNIITPNYNQQGGYHLYDFDITLHNFANGVWGTKINGGESQLDITGMVGKLLFNFWKIKLEFKTELETWGNERAAIILIVATKKNV